VAQSSDDAPGKLGSANRGAPPAWRKSTKSIANGQCIEIAALLNGRLSVRDSVDKAGPTATFTPNVWRTFLTRVKDGDFPAI
jgi:Domain of unknown function (DUF397)